jgi:type ISP restriction-modification system protein
VWINPIQYFGRVPSLAWDFQIGGYRVAEKWLKDRKGRKLTYDDVQHWQRIVVAIKESMWVNKEIEALIPGWPLP